jgi:hypothetical protein
MPITSASSRARISPGVLPSLGKTNRPTFNRPAASHTPLSSSTGTIMLGTGAHVQRLTGQKLRLHSDYCSNSGALAAKSACR